MQTETSILIVGTNGKDLVTRVRQARKDAPWTPVQMPFTEAKKILNESAPQAVILEHTAEDNGQVQEILRDFHSVRPQTYWALSGNDVSPAELIDFMRLGVHDFLKQPIENQELDAFLKRLEGWSESRNGRPKTKQALVSFFSTKGGVGLSMAAVQFSASLLRKKKKNILLADLVLQHGSLPAMLDLPAKYTLVELTENLDRVDQKLLESSLHRHTSGMFVLPAPHTPEEAERFASQDIGPVLKVLQQAFPFVVADAGHELNTATLSCLDHSDLIFLMTTPDLPSLCNTRIALDTFKRLGYPDEKIKLVLNRWQMKGEIDAQTIEKNLKYPVWHKLPDEPATVLKALNQGVLIEQVNAKSKLVKAFDSMIDLLPPQLFAGG